MKKTLIPVALFIVGLFSLCAGCTQVPLEKPSITPVGTPIPAEAATTVAWGYQGSKNSSLPVEMGSGVFIVRMQNTGTGPFTVLVENEEYYQQIIQGEGDVHAVQAIGVPAAGKFFLNVTSDGNWDISISRPETNLPAAPPLSLEGTGYGASGYISLPSGTTPFSLENNGEGPFAVWLYNETGGFVFDPSGSYLQPLHFHIGPYNGTASVVVPEAGRYVLSTISDGAWRVAVI